MINKNQSDTDSNKRLKKGFRILPHTDELIESHKGTAYNGERSTFVDEAVEYYCGVLDGSSSREILSDEVIRIIKAAVEDSSYHITRMMFKMAVEMAMMSDFIGSMGLDLDEEIMRKYRNRAYERVRKHHGMMSLEEVLKENSSDEC